MFELLGQKARSSAGRSGFSGVTRWRGFEAGHSWRVIAKQLNVPVSTVVDAYSRHAVD
jgi:hypothetical protein